MHPLLQGWATPVLESWITAQFGYLPSQAHLIQLISSLAGLLGVLEMGDHPPLPYSIQKAVLGQSIRYKVLYRSDGLQLCIADGQLSTAASSAS